MEDGKTYARLLVDEPAPEFKGMAYAKHFDGDFKEVSLADYRGKWLMLFFYPRDFTFI